jgi:hypothetical protein
MVAMIGFAIGTLRHIASVLGDILIELKRANGRWP